MIQNLKILSTLKQSLSELSNSLLDQLWLENGGPKNIHIVSLEKMECNGYLKDIIYGATNSPTYDGIHLRGPAASRHFTYRAVNAVNSVFWSDKTSLWTHIIPPKFQRNKQWGKQKNGGSANYHDDCPQSQFQWRKQSRVGSGSGQSGNRTGTGYENQSEDKQQIVSTFYSIPVQNRFLGNF